MSARRLALGGLLALTTTALGCGLVENFDGYSDRFDGGAPASGDTSAATDVRLDTGADDTSTTVDAGCPTGTDDCSGTCTHLDRDPANCGSCGTPVEDGAHWCVAGKSVCRPGTSPCKSWVTSGTPSYTVDCTNSASCTDTSSDGSHCKVSATSSSISRCYGSPSPSRCIGGDCVVASCPTGHKACPSTITGSESCWDIAHDSNNCGDCNIQCAPSQVCIEGACAAYRPVESCADCTGTLSQCCSAWTIPVCVATGSVCPATPGS